MSEINLCLEHSQKRVLVALGGNLHSAVGSPREALGYALANLRQRTNTVIRRSKYFITPCFPVGYGPDYVNAAVEFYFRGEALELLQILHDIEALFGRARDTRWGGRVLDLDLLVFGDEIAPSLPGYRQWRDKPIAQQIEQTPLEMILPHPRLQDRAFVLGPLMDIAPDWKHPVSGLKVREMYANLPASDRDALQPLSEL